jgi:glycerol-3-phosphate O-acyltransferase/dihydroxyacetone phosphate acyltransferase
VVPVGLNYFHAHKFRSRCVIEFGKPIQISHEDVERYEGDGRRDATGKILDEIHTAVRTVTQNTPDYDTLMVSVKFQNAASC